MRGSLGWDLEIEKIRGNWLYRDYADARIIGILTDGSAWWNCSAAERESDVTRSD
jgi:hypothetical protein